MCSVIQGWLTAASSKRYLEDFSFGTIAHDTLTTCAESISVCMLAPVGGNPAPWLASSPPTPLLVGDRGPVSGGSGKGSDSTSLWSKEFVRENPYVDDDQNMAAVGFNVSGIFRLSLSPSSFGSLCRYVPLQWDDGCVFSCWRGAADHASLAAKLLSVCPRSIVQNCTTP